MSINKEREGKSYDTYNKIYIDNYPETTTETTTESSAEPLGQVEKALEESLEEGIYGEKWEEIVERAVYAPTRFEYFVGLALQGLVVGRAERDIKTAVRNAMSLAKEVEALLDKAAD